MFYKYIFYKLYNWSSNGWEPYFPQFNSIFVISLLPLSNIYLILVLLDYFGIQEYSDQYIYSPSIKVLIVVFVSTLLFNQLYFFWINQWKSIIEYFNQNEVSSKTNVISNIYLIKEIPRGSASGCKGKFENLRFS